MIEKLSVSLWDLFAYFLSGSLVVFSVALHCTALGTLRGEQIAALEKVPAPVLLFVAIVGTPLIGMILEPVANMVDDGLELLVKKVGPERKVDQRLAKVHEALGGVVQREYMPTSVGAGVCQ